MPIEPLLRERTQTSDAILTHETNPNLPALPVPCERPESLATGTISPGKGLTKPCFPTPLFISGREIGRKGPLPPK